MTRLAPYLALLGALAAAFPATAADPNRGREAPADPKKVFRYAFEIAETSFDTQKISDLYSNIVNNAMFDAPLRYDYLMRPPKLIPNTVEALPELSADGTTYTFKVKPGIYFADDPVFKGKKRELVAADYVYSLKRLLDPKVRASQLGEIEPNVAGAAEAAEKARKSNSFDYDAPIEGFKAIDRYTFQVKLVKPLPTFVYNLADCRIGCALAREVVEHYGEDIGSHPVGSGPYRLAFWKRSSKIVLEANPNYREEYWDGEPPPGDEAAAALLKKMKGKRVPIVGRIEISVIEETQPRWLAFLNEEMDLMYQVPEEFANQAMPMNKLAKNLERRGIKMEQLPALDYTYAFFNMEDPMIGGYTPEKVALRRAITLSYNVNDEIAIIRKGQAVPAQTPVSDGRGGLRPQLPHQRQRVQRPEGARAPRHVRLRGPRRRRLPRDARRQPAGAALQLHADRARPAGRRAVEAQPRRHRREARGAQGEVAGPPQGGVRRQAADVVARRHRSIPDADTAPADPLRAEHRPQGQHVALPARRVRPHLREGALDARQPRAHQALPGHGAPGRSLRAVEDQHPPHPHRPLVPVGDRLPPPADRQRELVEVHRRRQGQTTCFRHEIAFLVPASGTSGLSLVWLLVWLWRSPAPAQSRRRIPTRSSGKPSRSPRPRSTRRRSRTCTRT
jgi:ABC-type transport system substrate-binding protein